MLLVFARCRTERENAQSCNEFTSINIYILQERMRRVAIGVFISSSYAFLQENGNSVHNHIYEYILQERILRVATGIYISLSPNGLEHDHLIQLSQLVGLSHNRRLHFINLKCCEIVYNGALDCIGMIQSAVTVSCIAST